ncbi:unnamed protein product [Arabis nemorensis]|uniref:Uncharacterized protein n=1 Tax=Arabis nemorensis TaxID=586526 RepID=A0A565B6Z0_9BRAS|nr:unnamed protein product [Arabis nemorensis]
MTKFSDPSQLWLTNSHLFKVEIVQVATETHEQQVDPLNAKNANVFIKYKDWDKADCKAVVRRVIDKRTGLVESLEEDL